MSRACILYGNYCDFQLAMVRDSHITCYVFRESHLLLSKMCKTLVTCIRFIYELHNFELAMVRNAHDGSIFKKYH